MSRNRLSIKKRLIMAIEDKIADPSTSRGDAQGWQWTLNTLRGRGSGPLPFYLRELAREWGIEK